MVLGSGKHRGWKCITFCMTGAQREKLAPERLPEYACLIEYPVPKASAVIACGCVSGLRVPTQQEIAEECSEVEAYGPVERELRIDHASIIFRDHYRARMKISVDECLGLFEKFLSEACRGDLQRPIAAKLPHNFVKLRRGVAIAIASGVGVRETEDDR